MSSEYYSLDFSSQRRNVISTTTLTGSSSVLPRWLDHPMSFARICTGRGLISVVVMGPT